MDGYIVVDEKLRLLAESFEYYQTPEWAIKAILQKEQMSKKGVFDPCLGDGRMAKMASEHSYNVRGIDIQYWGVKLGQFDFLLNADDWQHDFLKDPFPYDLTGMTIFMNPPFSLAVDFVERSFDLGAEKVIAFQRFAWWESRRRKDFWENMPPSRVYICGDRAVCWRGDIPEELRGIPKKKGGAGTSSPTAHAWFVWNKTGNNTTTLSHIWND